MASIGEATTLALRTALASIDGLRRRLSARSQRVWQLRAGYLLSSLLIATFIWHYTEASERMIAHSLAGSEHTNRSGRQRMLSERIGARLLLLMNTPAEQNRRELATLVRLDLAELEAAAEQLDENYRSHDEDDSPENNPYEHWLVAERQRVILSASVRKIVEELEHHSGPDSICRDEVDGFLLLVDEYVGLIDDAIAVLTADLEADHRVQLQWAHTLRLTTLMLLALSALFIYEPIIRRLVRSRESERDLREELARLAEVAKRTTNAVIVTYAQRRVVWVNEGFTRITGYTFEDVRGRVPGHLLQYEGTNPDAVATIRTALRENRGCRVEIRNRGKTGRIYWLDVEIQPLHGPEGLTGFMAVESDITEQVAQRETLAEQVRRLEEAEALANLGHWSWEVETNRVRWSRQIYTIHERPPALGPPDYAGVLAQFAPDSARRLDMAVQEALATGASYSLRLRTNRAEEQYLAAEGHARRDASDRIVGLYGTVHDITKQVLAERSLIESESRFRQLADAMPMMAWLTDENGNCIDINRAWLDFHGADFCQALGEGWTIFIHPDERAICIDACREAYAARRPLQLTFRARRHDGVYRWLHDFGVPRYGLRGEYLGYAGGCVDVTERIEAEERIREQSNRLELIIRGTGLGTWEWNIATGYVRYNDLWAEMLGYSPEEVTPCVRTWEQLVHPDDLPRVRYELEEYLAGRRPDFRSEVRMLHRDGSIVWVLTTGKINQFADDGQPLLICGIHVNITAIKLAEEELRKARDAAETANRAKSEFLANMSHEIRTPMTAILGYTDLLTEEGAASRPPAERVECVAAIKRNGEHLLSLINDILDISKIESGKLVIESVSVDLPHLLIDVVELMRGRAEAKRIAFELVYDCAIPANIMTDPVRLRQILVNLLGNAIKFTDTGGVTLRVGVCAAESDSATLSLRVIDTGIGISRDQMQRLFGYFEQADASTTRKYGGSGLGLRISQKLAEALGGSIQAVCELGRGCTFELRLPLGCIRHVALLQPAAELSGANAPTTTAAPQADNRPADGERLKGCRILLVEDGPDNQRLIAHHLRRAGALVQIADNGLAALHQCVRDGDPARGLLDELPFDLIISDMQMPEMDGYTFARTLRKLGCRLPIVALTAHAMSEDADKCFAAGCTGYATKPIDRDSLVSACARLVSPRTASAAAPAPPRRASPAPPDSQAQPVDSGIA